MFFFYSCEFLKPNIFDSPGGGANKSSLEIFENESP